MYNYTNCQLVETKSDINTILNIFVYDIFVVFIKNISRI